MLADIYCYGVFPVVWRSKSDTIRFFPISWINTTSRDWGENVESFCRYYSGSAVNAKLPWFQDYHWWWRSFIISGGSAVYVFAYAAFYFMTKVRWIATLQSFYLLPYLHYKTSFPYNIVQYLAIKVYLFFWWGKIWNSRELILAANINLPFSPFLKS